VKPRKSVLGQGFSGRGRSWDSDCRVGLRLPAALQL